MIPNKSIFGEISENSKANDIRKLHSDVPVQILG
jgi:hypothetical protein